MGKRGRRRGGPPAGGKGGKGPSSFADLGLDLDLGTGDAAEEAAGIAPPTEVDHTAPDGSVLALRTAMTPGTRREYAALLAGERSSAGAAREDVWQRAVEFLFERLAVRWTIAGVATEGQGPLLARLRAATSDERRAV